MSINIVIEDKVTFKVTGSINTAAGIAKPFDFKLTCLRLDTEEIEQRIKDTDTSVIDFMVDVVEDWHGVRGPSDSPVPYTETAYRQLCKIPGVARVAYITYLTEVGAKAKN